MICDCVPPYIGPPIQDTCGATSYLLFMSLLNTFITNDCSISEICQRNVPKTEPDLEYDFVVIGAGSGGATAAGRLSEIENWKVLLLEAGGDEPPASHIPSMTGRYIGNAYLDWNYKTDPQEHACLGNEESRCRWPRGKVLGGCTVLYGMMYMRGPPRDYDNWAELGNTGWSYEEVLPIFFKSEDNQEIGTLVDAKYHTTGGPMTVSRFNYHPAIAEDTLAAAAELGYPVSDDLTGDQYSGFAIAQTIHRNGTRLSSARAFVRDNRDRPNLHVMINSTATRIIVDTNDGQKTATGVEFVYNDQVYTVKVNKEVVVAAGAVNSPQVLLLSGIGPKEELDKVGIEQVHELPGVGQNLHNHVAFSVSYQVTKGNAFHALDWNTASDYIINRQGPLSSTGMSQVSGRINSKYADPSGTYPDLQFFFGGNIGSCASQTMKMKAADDSNLPDAPQTYSISPVVLHPKSRGSVGLNSNNPLDPPSMNPNYLAEPEDVATLVEGVRIAQRIANTTVMQDKYGLVFVKNSYGDCEEKYGFDTDEFWECGVRYATGAENHQAGSCKMGPSSDPLAVVDPELRVYGIEGLRVMDASIMPNVVSGNTHASIVMIADKGVDHIKEKWLSENTTPAL